MSSDFPGESSGCAPTLTSMAELEGFGQKFQYDFQQVMTAGITIFLIVMQLLFLVMFGTVAFFHQELAVTIKEFRNSWYGGTTAFVARTVMDTLFRGLFMMISAVTLYYGLGYPTGGDDVN